MNSRCDYSNYFLNLLHWGWIRWQADGNGFIPLKGEYLRKFIRKELWTELRDSLINAGVIECDWHYIKGEKSYGYRLTPRYATKAKKVLCRDQDLARKIREHQNNFMPVHKWLSSHFERLDFDLELAKATIPTLPMKDDCKITREQFELQASELARRCAAREHRNSVCRFGRFHTNLTSMSKNLRACLSVDGQQLVGVDLANSQPLIAAICAKRFYQNKDSKTRLLNKVFQEGQSVYSDRELRSLEKKVESIISNTSLHMQPSSSPSLSPSYTMSESSQVVNSVPGLRHAETAKFVDLERYQSVCEKGTLYESLMKSSEIRWKFKKKFFTYVFFGSNSCRSELKTRFYKAYPSIGKMLETIKRKDYRLSSHLMQNYESTIFIHRICGALMREHRDMPVFTIHDSILTLPEHLDAVKNIIYREFDKLGVKPTLRDESYL